MQFVVVAGCALLFTGLLQSATFTVSSTTDAVDATPGDGICETASGNGVCTLRAAVQEAGALAGANTVVVPPDTYLLSATPVCIYRLPSNGNAIAENLSALCVHGNITTQGAGASATIIDAGGAGGATCCSSYPSARGMLVSQDATLNLSGVTMQNGRSNGGYLAFSGGGINNSGILTVSNSAFIGNTGIPGGGGIWNNGRWPTPSLTLGAL